MSAQGQLEGPETHSDIELEKTTLEVADLKRRSKWWHQVAQYLSMVTAFVAVAALFLSLQQYYDQQKRNDEAKEREFRKPFWEKQITLYFEASTAAAKIATLPRDHKESKEAEERFWQLYWGPLVLVEDNDVKNAMIAYGNCLNGLTKECRSEDSQPSQLQSLSLDLANKFRASIGTSWDIRFDNLYIQDNTPKPVP